MAVGSGITGLTSAYLMAEGGLQVSIIARDLPRGGGIGRVSLWVGAALIPPSDMGEENVAKESYCWHSRIATEDPSSGVQLSSTFQGRECLPWPGELLTFSQVVKATEFYTGRDTDDTIWCKDFFLHYRRISDGLLPTSCQIGFSF